MKVFVFMETTVFFWTALLSIPFAFSSAQRVPNTAAALNIRPKTIDEQSFTPDNLQGLWLIEFFSPYCPHCQSLAPKWQEAFLDSGAVNTYTPGRLAWGSVNCIEHGDLCASKDIRFFPAIKVYRDGEELYMLKNRDPSSDDLWAFAQHINENGEEALRIEHEIASESDINARKASKNQNTKGKDIQELTSDEFKPQQMHGLWLIEFYSPYCPLCKDFAPKYKGAFEDFLSITEVKAHELRWAAVNCVESADLCNVENVRGYPSISLYKNGRKMHQYRGSLERAAIIDYAKSILKNPNLETLDAGYFPENESVDLPAQESALSDSAFYKDNSAPKAWAERSEPYSTGVSVSFTPADFEKLVNKTTNQWIIKFYSPRCLHCQNMASSWTQFARNVKGRLNVGEVDCDKYFDLCENCDIIKYPTIRMYLGGGVFHDYKGEYLESGYEVFAKAAIGAYATIVNSISELRSSIIENHNLGINTFVFLYDDSVVAEDWDAMGFLAQNLAAEGARLYYMPNKERFANNGKDMLYPVIAFVEMSKKSGSLHFYEYPDSYHPLKLRDMKDVLGWANKIRFATMQQLDPVLMSQYAPIQCILITEDTNDLENVDIFDKHRELAALFYQHYLEKQQDDQDNLRAQRTRKYYQILKQGSEEKANQVLQVPINAPLRPEVVFAYISVSDWHRNYSLYLDVSRHQARDIVLTDFANQIYLDELNGIPLSANEITIKEAASQLLRKDRLADFQHMRHLFPGVKVLKLPEIKFEVPENKLWTILKRISRFCIALMCSLIFLRLITIWLKRTSRRPARQSLGYLASGKQD